MRYSNTVVDKFRRLAIRRRPIGTVHDFVEVGDDFEGLAANEENRDADQ